jgi:hypothetical protein
LGSKTKGGGLRPPGDSSVAPNGIPTRPTDDGELSRLGDKAEPADEAVGGVSNVAELSPGVASSVAPRGMPIGPTDEPRPSGEVKPSGDVAPILTDTFGDPGPMPNGEVGPITSTCAKA